MTATQRLQALSKSPVLPPELHPGVGSMFSMMVPRSNRQPDGEGEESGQRTIYAAEPEPAVALRSGLPFQAVARGCHETETRHHYAHMRLFANSILGQGATRLHMIKLISSQSDRPLPKRLYEDLPAPVSDGGIAVGSAGRTAGHGALRKLLVLIEAQSHKSR